ncbi:MAG: hypothetical protein IJV73_07150 [Clostridia bacterium]|nr:hypothetical protein [Clostridia bacterium]
MGWIMTVVNVAIYALAIWLISALLRLDRIKSLISAILGVLLAKGIMQILPSLGAITGYLNIVAMILCVALIAWLLGRNRFKSLLAATLGILLGNLINSLVAPILSNLF